MNRIGRYRRTAAMVAFAAMTAPALPAPGDLDAEPARTAPRAALIIDYALDTEMVVRNWVLCVSETVAEQLVHAREESPVQARATYAALNQAKSCGQFAELRVILKERLYTSTAESGHDARVFGALVDFAGSWASAYVVYGGLPER